ncbi:MULTISPECIES: LysR substrate-binding domain-containing protein [unclassified Peribacillus]|uniref:LysR substrate-binding domain-containing protein n=1 Tax=unclassified Peribacillus TaxID=2675266 RepID=UPI00339023D4
MGISFLSKSAVQKELNDRVLVEIPFPQDDKLKRETYLMYKEDSFSNPAIKRFIDISQQLLSENPSFI